MICIWILGLVGSSDFFGLFQVAMTAVTVGFVIGQATSTRQSPIYKAILDFDTGVQSKVVIFLPCFVSLNSN